MHLVTHLPRMWGTQASRRREGVGTEASKRSDHDQNVRIPLDEIRGDSPVSPEVIRGPSSSRLIISIAVKMAVVLWTLLVSAAGFQGLDCLLVQ